MPPLPPGVTYDVDAVRRALAENAVVLREEYARLGVDVSEGEIERHAIVCFNTQTWAVRFAMDIELRAALLRINPEERAS